MAPILPVFEHPSEPLLPRHLFLRRLARHGALAGAVLVASLGLGMAGFHWLCGEEWMDAFLNASMLLGGMGLVGEIPNALGKLFAGFYALYAGIVFLGACAVVLAPVVHRALHKLRQEEGRPGE